jgi:glutathione S-transferase
MPALEIGPTAVVESGAIVQHIAERYDRAGALAPSVDSPERAEYLMWLHYSETILGFLGAARIKEIEAARDTCRNA